MAEDRKDVIINQLTAQIEEYNENLQSHMSKSKKRRGIINTIAEKCCNSNYGFSQLGGDNEILSMSDIEMRDFIIDNILAQKQDYISMISELQSQYLEENRLKDELSKKYLDLKEENKILKNKIANLEQRLALMPKQATAQQPQMSQLTPNNKRYRDFENKDTSSVNDNDIVYIDNEPFSVQKVKQQITTPQMVVIKCIATSGLSEFQEILNQLLEKGELKDKIIRSSIDELVQLHVLSETMISTPIRSKVKLLELSELGKSIYYKETKKKPKLSEADSMRHNHASLKHGYCIKETAKSLEKQGYGNVCYDSKKNTIQLADNRRYVPDITADHSQSVKTYWEVELAHHTDADFFEKLDKAMKVTPNLYIIAPDKEAKTKLAKQIEKYRKKLYLEDAAVKFTIFLGTLNELEKRQIFTNDKECKFVINS